MAQPERARFVAESVRKLIFFSPAVEQVNTGVGVVERGRGWGMAAGYLVGRPGGRLVLVVGEDEERQCAELRVLQGGVELVASGFKVLVR